MTAKRLNYMIIYETLYVRDPYNSMLPFLMKLQILHIQHE
jgi:hypothetical protein